MSKCDIAGCDNPYFTLVMTDDGEIQVCEEHRWA